VVEPCPCLELAAIRQATVYKNSRKQRIDDTPTLLLLRWAGLRVSDAVRLQWKHIHFGRGSNGEVEILTQKRTKVAIIPLATELRENLEMRRGESRYQAPLQRFLRFSPPVPKDHSALKGCLLGFFRLTLLVGSSRYD
jgi:integrase